MAGITEPRCIWNLLTGLYCPGCGTWRAIKALLAGDFTSAFIYNPYLFLLAAPFAVYMAFIYLKRWITKTWTPSIFSSPKAVWPVMGVITGVWILRNVFPPPQ
jgi:hypothetical protein